MLQDEGIVISTATAIDIEKILAETDAEKLLPLSELKYVLSPVISRNKEEQEAIYKIFDGLDSRIKDIYKPESGPVDELISPIIVPKPTSYKTKLIRYLIIALASVALIAGGFIAYQSLFPTPSVPLKILALPQPASINDTLNLEVQPGPAVNKKEVSFSWKFSDSTVASGLAVKKILKDTLPLSMVVYQKNNKGKITDTASYSVTPLCEPPPSVAINEADISENGSKLSGGYKKQFTASFTNPSPNKDKYTYKWYINDTLFSTSQTVNYAKEYNTIKLVVGCKGIHCSADSLVSRVLESVPAVNVAVKGSGVLFGKMLYNWRYILFCIILLLLIPVALLWGFYKIIHTLKRRTPKVEQPEPGMEGPYKIEFAGQEHHINTEANIRKLADILRKRQVSDIFRLNIRKTIRSTIASGGIPKLEFSPLSKPLSFLVFIDKENPDSQLVKLFEYLVEKLKKEEVNICAYEYFKEPLFLSNEKLNHYRIPLQRLSVLYPDTVLFIFGNAQHFFLPLKGTVKSWVTEKLNNWPSRILITPYAKDDWSISEELLIKSGLTVLSADFSSIDQIDGIISMQLDALRMNAVQVENGYRSRFLDFQDMEVLKTYLGEGALLQWVCSLAVYPDIDWNLTLAIGKAIEKQYQQTGKRIDLVNYTNLLRLSRILWMQDGSINESLRIKMLSHLDRDAEALARQTLKDMLSAIEHNINDNSFVKSKFDIHKNLNQFLLSSYYKKTITNQEAAFFEELIKNNQLDEGQDIYITEGKNTLLPQPFGKASSINPDGYFKRRAYQHKIFACVISLLLAVPIVFLIFNKVKSAGYLNWGVQVEQTYIINVKGNLPDKKIGMNLQYTPEKNMGQLRTYAFSDTTDTIFIKNVKITDTTGSGMITLATPDGRLISNTPFKLNSSVYNINLSQAAKTLLKIYYNGAATLALANSVTENLPSRFNFSIAPQTVTDTAAARVYYFSAGHKADAQEAANTVNSVIPGNVVPQLVDSAKFQQKGAPVIIYINSYRGGVELPQSVNEIWHGGTSNRLLNINLAKHVLYYSVNSTTTYGTYSIYEVSQTKNGVYKIITKSNEGYKLFFIRNVALQSFDLSVCQDFVQTKAELDSKDESYCDKFNTMTLYYPNNQNIVYLPVSGNILFTNEQTKFQQLINNNVSGKSLKIRSIKLYNTNFTKPATRAQLNLILRRMINYSDSIKISQGVMQEYNPAYVNPFQRNFITIQSDFDPCSQTITSLKDALSKPLEVCNLDLSAEFNKRLPDQLTLFKNMKTLNLGYIAFDASEVAILSKKLAGRCKITYYTKGILWVDDHPENNQALIDEFNASGIGVVIAKSNIEAYQWIQQGRTFDVIISDIVRDKEGAEAGLQIKQYLTRYKMQAPLIFYTDKASKYTDADKNSLGAVLVSYSESEVKEKVLELLSPPSVKK
ncbi:MAG: hypothetical protein JWQ57_2107 [Mucilaginibacter sp.]|nr:hypothetical protein [Mucilaginibacter sp.]